MCQLNIRSLLPKLEELDFTLLDGTLDFVGFTESWLHPRINDTLLNKEGYNIERQDRANGKRGGGLCCYIKDTIDYTRLDRNVNDINAEIMSIILRRANQKDILIILTYRPPQGNINLFIENLRNHINEVRNQKSMNMVVMGDFNIDYAKKTDSQTKKLVNLEKEFLLEQVICKPTRVGYRKTSVLDLMFTDLKFVAFAEPLETYISDHYPTVLVYKKYREEKKQTEITIRDMSEINITDLKQALSNHDWSYVHEYEVEVDLIWDKLYKDIIQILDRHCPFKTVRIKKDRPEYITDVIIEKCHLRDKLFKRARKTMKLQDWIEARKQRQIVNYAVRKAKADFLKDKIVQAKGDSKKFWTSIRKLIPNTKGRVINSIINHTNEELFEEKAASYINKFFCSIGSKLVNNIPEMEPPVISEKTYNVQISHDYIWLEDISEREVLKEVEKLDINKSSGFIEMNTRAFKIIFRILIKEYTRIINLCKRQNVFIEKWKHAITVPIPKKGNIKDVNNLRPISLIPVAGKIMERFINSHLMEHMEGNNFFAKCQGVFVKRNLLYKQFLN